MELSHFLDLLSGFICPRRQQPIKGLWEESNPYLLRLLRLHQDKDHDLYKKMMGLFGERQQHDLSWQKRLKYTYILFEANYLRNLIIPDSALNRLESDGYFIPSDVDILKNPAVIIQYSTDNPEYILPNTPQWMTV